jgi:hypothetical protein
MPNVHDIWRNKVVTLSQADYDTLRATTFESINGVPMVIGFTDVNGTASEKRPTQKEIDIFKMNGGVEGGSASALRQFNRVSPQYSNTGLRQIMANMSDNDISLQIAGGLGAGIGNIDRPPLPTTTTTTTEEGAAAIVPPLPTVNGSNGGGVVGGGGGVVGGGGGVVGGGGVELGPSGMRIDISKEGIDFDTFRKKLEQQLEDQSNAFTNALAQLQENQEGFGPSGAQGIGINQPLTNQDRELLNQNLLNQLAELRAQVSAFGGVDPEEVKRLQAEESQLTALRAQGTALPRIPSDLFIDIAPEGEKPTGGLTAQEFSQAVAAIQRGEDIPASAMRFIQVNVPMTDAMGKTTMITEQRPTAPTQALQQLAAQQRQITQFGEQLTFQESQFAEQQRVAAGISGRPVEPGERPTLQAELSRRQQTEQERAALEQERVQSQVLLQEIASSSQERALALEEMKFTKKEAILARGERKDELDQRATEAQNQFDLADRQLKMQQSQLAGLTGVPVPEGEVPQRTLEAQLARAGLSGQFEGAQTLEAELARGSLAARGRETDLGVMTANQQQHIQQLMVQQEQLESNRRFELESALAGGRLPSGEQSLQAAMMRGVVPGGDLTLEGQQLAEQVRQFDLQQMLQEAGISGLIRGEETLEAELARGQLQLGKRQTGISARLGFGQLEQQRQALEAQQARSALEAQTALTRSAFEQPFGFGAFRALGGLGAAPPAAQQPMVQGLSGLGFQIPRTPQGQGLAGTPTPPSSFFPRGIPTMGALAQTPAAGQQFLQSVLGMTGTSPSQFAQMSGAITPTARPVKLPEILRRGLPAGTRA